MDDRSIEEQMDFLLDSLRDLEREHRAGAGAGGAVLRAAAGPGPGPGAEAVAEPLSRGFIRSSSYR